MAGKQQHRSERSSQPSGSGKKGGRVCIGLAALSDRETVGTARTCQFPCRARARQLHGNNSNRLQFGFAYVCMYVYVSMCTGSIWYSHLSIRRQPEAAAEASNICKCPRRRTGTVSSQGVAKPQLTSEGHFPRIPLHRYVRWIEHMKNTALPSLSFPPVASLYISLITGMYTTPPPAIQSRIVFPARAKPPITATAVPCQQQFKSTTGQIR